MWDAISIEFMHRYEIFQNKYRSLMTHIYAFFRHVNELWSIEILKVFTHPVVNGPY